MIILILTMITLLCVIANSIAILSLMKRVDSLNERFTEHQVEYYRREKIKGEAMRKLIKFIRR